MARTNIDLNKLSDEELANLAKDVTNGPSRAIRARKILRERESNRRYQQNQTLYGTDRFGAPNIPEYRDPVLNQGGWQGYGARRRTKYSGYPDSMIDDVIWRNGYMDDSSSSTHNLREAKYELQTRLYRREEEAKRNEPKKPSSANYVEVEPGKSSNSERFQPLTQSNNTSAASSSDSNSSNNSTSQRTGGYKVQRGDTLWDISQATGISVDDLRKNLNGQKFDIGASLDVDSDTVNNYYQKKKIDRANRWKKKPNRQQSKQQEKAQLLETKKPEQVRLNVPSTLVQDTPMRAKTEDWARRSAAQQEQRALQDLARREKRGRQHEEW